MGKTFKEGDRVRLLPYDSPRGLPAEPLLTFQQDGWPGTVVFDHPFRDPDEPKWRPPTGTWAIGPWVRFDERDGHTAQVVFTIPAEAYQLLRPAIPGMRMFMGVDLDGPLPAGDPAHDL